ncbi:hypothetical protein BDP27DRAFT_1376607 [Rhodocollybia butyracea]|uniref:Uncharacterized protein n=1 Tax=Rhodocollybia butyracea TaxID=206335 RepID=A0A9P5TVT0_9AGAR|nr:hypothetical protein BDP27DRAFT_1376607 [Rhodocollybia butyracea]
MNKAAGAFISEDVCSIKDKVPLWLEDHLLKDLQIKSFEMVSCLAGPWVHICVDMGVCFPRFFKRSMVSPLVLGCAQMLCGRKAGPITAERQNQSWDLILGKAVRFEISAVTPDQVAYCAILLMHTMSAADDRRNNKASTGDSDTIMAFFHDKEIIDKDFLEWFHHQWDEYFQYGHWTLPEKKKATKVNKNDRHSSHQQALLAIQEKKQRIAEAAPAPAVVEKESDEADEISPSPPILNHRRFRCGLAVHTLKCSTSLLIGCQKRSHPSPSDKLEPLHFRGW